MVALSFDDLTGKNRQIPQQEEEKPTPIPKSIGYPVSKDAVNDELLSLFPSPVLIAQYPVPYEKELEYIQNLPCRRENKGGDVGQKIHYNRQSEDTFVLDNPELSNVREFIKSKIFKFVREIMCSKDEVVITQSWINKSGKGESHHEHVHPNSMISGVWYPVINEQLPPIQFRSRTQRDISFSNEKFNNFNSATFLLPMKMGEIIIFPSNLSHCVPANQSETERISLAFNTWVKGSLGDINSLTYLPLDRCV